MRLLKWIRNTVNRTDEAKQLWNSLYQLLRDFNDLKKGWIGEYEIYQKRLCQVEEQITNINKNFPLLNNLYTIITGNIPMGFVEPTAEECSKILYNNPVKRKRGRPRKVKNASVS